MTQRARPRERPTSRRSRRGIAATLRRYVIESGMTNKHLARRTGMGLSTAYRFLQGEDIRLKHADRIAALLGLELIRRRRK